MLPANVILSQNYKRESFVNRFQIDKLEITFWIKSETLLNLKKLLIHIKNKLVTRTQHKNVDEPYSAIQNSSFISFSHQSSHKKVSIENRKDLNNFFKRMEQTAYDFKVKR